jgi:hypothetical protein
LVGRLVGRLVGYDRRLASDRRSAIAARCAASVTPSIDLVPDTRECAQCGTVFVPLREHARFCSAVCRVAWNRQAASNPASEEGALGWSVVAMRETTDRLLRARAWDQPHAFWVISEAVWWVTMVDATLVRYHPDTYGLLLADYDSTSRRVIEDTFAGLRFVRNQMGYEADHDDFIEPRPDGGAAASELVADWTWKPVCEPALGGIPPRGQDWEMTRYRAYQAQLAGHPVGETFRRAAAFLRLASDRSLSHA